MEDAINRICGVLEKDGWTVLRQDGIPSPLSEWISGRYHNLPKEWAEFVSGIRVCVDRDGTAWFLCGDDFDRQGDGAFRWNEFELISLQAAADEGDTEWQSAITAFWDNHLPIYYSVADGYEYNAIRMSDGAVVHGAEPEFEETREVAPSFARFMELVCAGWRQN